MGLAPGPLFFESRVPQTVTTLNEPSGKAGN